MSCPKCGAPWRKLEGNKLVCSRCGYIETLREVKTVEQQLEEAMTEIKRLKKDDTDTPQTHQNKK